ncbi:aldehyde dehydrogenase domain-containing protein [Biscogniauxia sp. FL1348]|nr:aldehyde dehydrogenase domain-containing protein [Biscogniauxia sp. FL1348]
MTLITVTGIGGRQISVPSGLFIHNKWVASTEGTTLDVENPSTGKHLATVSAAQKQDVDRAVSSAKTAYEGWKTTSPTVRARLLLKLADLVEEHAEDLGSLEALEGGCLYQDSTGIFIPQAVDCLRYFAGWADKLDGDSMTIPQGIAYTRREPIGVCAAIVPWNTLLIAFWKIAPAIAAGNVIIIKTPELTPLWGQKTAQLVLEAGFPPGVINIIPGIGTVAGQALSEHSDVKKIAFTGSPGAGRQVLAASARTNLKKVSLELGGKGPSIVFADADWDNALLWTTNGIMYGNGQLCIAGSRIYIQDSIYDKFVEQFAARCRDAVHGDPLLPETTKGSIVSQLQAGRIMEYVKKGKESGAKLLYGGEMLPGPGYFIANTAFADVDQQAPIMQEEVFGPLASIARFHTEDEVIAKANDTTYGLSAAVFTSDINKAFRVSEAIEAGTVTINAWGLINANTPFGGVKQSGFGRDLGKEALEDWTVTKAVKWNILTS